MTSLQLSTADASISQFCIEQGMTKKQAISARILLLQNKGASHEQAFNQVLGANAFNQLVDDVYETLRAA